MVKCRKGFTRVDLMVTLLCAAFLVMTLGAAGNRGRGRAQQLVCGSQLGKWGKAIIMHSADNDGEIMSIARRWSGVPLPHYMASIEDYSDMGPSYGDAQEGEWNAYAINPYLDIINADYANNGIVTRFVSCPSVKDGFMQDWIRENNWLDPYWSFDFMEMAYVFWGRADGLSAENRSANAQEVLTLNELSAERLLMSDILLLTGSPTSEMAYRYNHGQDGWSWNGYGFGIHSDQSPNPKATGRNQLFGDGRVRWKVIPENNNLPTHLDMFFQQNNGMWNGADSGWVGDEYDISYF
jgi:hypothetical protein